jgi:hypothetical protein
MRMTDRRKKVKFGDILLAVRMNRVERNPDILSLVLQRRPKVRT